MTTRELKHAGRDDADVAKHFNKGEMEKLNSLDFQLKEVKNPLKQLGL